MGEMGFRNLDAVIACSENKRLLRPRGDGVTFDPMAFSLLAYMARHAYDWPPTPDMRAAHVPCRVYSRGWSAPLMAFGMDAISPKVMLEGDLADVTEAKKLRWDSSIVRISKTSKFLQEQGLIKLLRKADVRREYNADWILMIGDADENRQVEEWARECLPYMKRRKSVRPEE